MFRPPTDDKKHLHCYVTDDGGACSRDRVIVRREADIVGDGDSHVEGSQQDQPIPQSLGDAVVEQNEARLLHRRHFVLRYGWLVHHVLSESV